MEKLSLIQFAVCGFLAIGVAVGNVIICEGSRDYVSCPSGTQISINSANYGRTRDGAICPHPSIRDLNCHSSVSLTKVKEACDRKQECYLYASNSVFGDPCVYTYKYLEIDYTCVAPSGGNLIICEHRTDKLSCPSGKQISINSANYGRTRDGAICPHPSIRDLNCHSSVSLTKVEAACAGKQECVLYASNSVFGDPCRGTYKYLEIGYTCVEASVGNVIICEGSRDYLSCPSGTRISINSANYGRTRDGAICPHFSIRDLNCHSSVSLTKVEAACAGKQECVLYASNSVFGDPCVYTYKYLEIGYTCVAP